jgi:hypothetical protein
MLYLWTRTTSFHKRSTNPKKDSHIHFLHTGTKDGGGEEPLVPWTGSPMNNTLILFLVYNSSHFVSCCHGLLFLMCPMLAGLLTFLCFAQGARATMDEAILAPRVQLPLSKQSWALDSCLVYLFPSSNGIQPTLQPLAVAVEAQPFKGWPAFGAPFSGLARMQVIVNNMQKPHSNVSAETGCSVWCIQRMQGCAVVEAVGCRKASKSVASDLQIGLVVLRSSC